MNDLHFCDTTTRCPIEYTDFWLAHPQYWLNEDIGWKSRGALNFSFKEVREQKLNMIKEQIDKYGELLNTPPGFVGFFADDLKEVAALTRARLDRPAARSADNDLGT